MVKKTLLVDFDATLSNYTGWQGLTHLDEPLDKARKAMIILSREFKLVCFTTRAIESPELVEQWLRRWGFPVMEVTATKKPAHLIIDDRALTFPGKWSDEFLQSIRDFKPHWQTSTRPAPHEAPEYSSPEGPDVLESGPDS